MLSRPWKSTFPTPSAALRASSIVRAMLMGSSRPRTPKRRMTARVRRMRRSPGSSAGSLPTKMSSSDEGVFSSSISSSSVDSTGPEAWAVGRLGLGARAARAARIRAAEGAGAPRASGRSPMLVSHSPNDARRASQASLVSSPSNTPNMPVCPAAASRSASVPYAASAASRMRVANCRGPSSCRAPASITATGLDFQLCS